MIGEHQVCSTPTSGQLMLPCDTSVRAISGHERQTALIVGKVARSEMRKSTDARSAAMRMPPTASGVGGIALVSQISIFSAISMASSTTMPR